MPNRTAAILLRLSHAKDEAGAEDDAIDRQEQACRSYAAANGLDVVAVYNEGDADPDLALTVA